MSFDAPEPWRPPAAAPAPNIQPSAQERVRLRPPVGIPTPPARRGPSTLLAIALHVLVLFLLITPLVAPVVLREITGAGDDGPQGGGGGGSRGTGGDNGGWNVRERLLFVQVAPSAPAPAVAPAPRPPVIPPPLPPVIPPPKPATPPLQQPAAPAPTTPAASPSAAAGVAAPTPGEGGGTGADGSSGSGPGAGGGVGAGVGTGRGGGTGPGTGGGAASVLPPQSIEMFLPPLPQPARVRGFEVIAVFDVDSTGRVLSFDFTQTPDRGYNKKLREVLAGFRFRPGTRADGTPTRAQVSYTYSL